MIQTLKSLARKGRTVIVSVHQPSSQMFHEFDDLILMSQGVIVYAGNREDAIPYFAKLGYECPPAYNPADFMSMFVLLLRG